MELESLPQGMTCHNPLGFLLGCMLSWSRVYFGVYAGAAHVARLSTANRLRHSAYIAESMEASNFART